MALTPAEVHDSMNGYQAVANTTAIYPAHGTGEVVELMYLGLGMNGEAGEVADIAKKLYRDGGDPHDPAVRARLQEEMGDVLWYIAVLAGALNMTLSELAQANMEKLQSRQARGVLGGSGDHR